MLRLLAPVLLVTSLACGSADKAPVATGPYPLIEARAGYTDDLHLETTRFPAPTPPEGVLELVTYAAPLGANAAYVSPARSGPRRPAIVWIAGGMDWGIDSGAWEPAPWDNDQSAAAFRDAGLVLMRPSLRGSNENPGRNEAFLGEVDDVRAAADFLASRADVDPTRIYLGGHSTGGTLALLAVATSSQFRAVFALGPVADPRQYGPEVIPANVTERAASLRAPVNWTPTIRTPTWIIEGADGNADVLHMFKLPRRSSAPLTIVEVPGADHFSLIRPVSELIAVQILADTGPSPSFRLDAAAVAAAVRGK